MAGDPTSATTDSCNPTCNLGNSTTSFAGGVDIGTAAVTTIVGNGVPGDIDNAVGVNARLNGPGAITTDGTTLWIADGANRKIKAVDLTPPFAVTTVAGSGMQVVVDRMGIQ